MVLFSWSSNKDEDGSHASNVATNAPTDVATIACEKDRTNDYETVIGVDTASEEPEVHLFTTMKNKLDLLTSEAQKMAKAAAIAAKRANSH